MSSFGFSFEALYRLDVAELQELSLLIRGESYHPPKTKEALIRGVIIPFLREAGKSPKNATKDQVMETALVRAAKSLGIRCNDWGSAETAWLVRQVKLQVAEAFRKRFEEMDEGDRKAILVQADQDLNKRAQQMGLSFVPAAAVVAGEMSGFGIYLGTTQALAALSTAIGITFPWAIYQGATTALGVILGPVGWVLVGAGVLAGGAGYFSQRLKRRDEKLKVVVATISLYIRNPYKWFGLTEDASMPQVKSAYRAMMKTFHPDKVERELPDWVKGHFNEMLLKTQESFERIKRHKEETEL